MIYQAVTTHVPLSQGDVIDHCPILAWDFEPDAKTAGEPGVFELRVIVLTQACDLAQTRSSRVVVAVVHDAQGLVNRGILQAKTITDHIRSHRVYGWYFLPAGPVPESVIDFRDLHTVP